METLNTCESINLTCKIKQKSRQYLLANNDETLNINEDGDTGI